MFGGIDDRRRPDVLGTAASNYGLGRLHGRTLRLRPHPDEDRLEYNYGSKNWITFVPAADDMWTTKLGTRGNVYEAYLIQEINLKPISSYLSKAFFRFGYQYYDFEYTGSNNWVGAPVKIADLAATP